MKKRSSPKSAPKSSPKTPSKKSSTASADEVAELIRADLTKDGLLAIANLASGDVESQIRDWVSTQSLALDRMLGTPGLPCGRITEIYGKNHSGKSTVAAHMMAEVQRRGGIAYLLDQEGTLDEAYFRRIGVDCARLQIIRPKERTIEAGADALEDLAERLRPFPHILSGIFWDTIAAAPAKKELEQLYDEKAKQQPGYGAKSIRGWAKRMTARIANSRACVLVLNQSYTNIGQTYGDPEVAYGGEGLKFYASVRLHMKLVGRLPDDVEGSLSRVTCKKSKVSQATFRQCEVALARGQGIDNVYTIYNELSERKLVAFAGGGNCSVRMSESEELRWRGAWKGLVERCTREPETYTRLCDAYRALTAAPVLTVPPAPASPEATET